MALVKGLRKGLKGMLLKKDALLREVKAFEDSVGVTLEAGARGAGEAAGRSAAATEERLRELAESQARPFLTPI